MNTKKNGKKMTAQEAKTFETFSRVNAAILWAESEKRGCSCTPYQDWFTFRRWIAQGYVVKNGEHGVKLSTFKTVIRVEKNGNGEEVERKISIPNTATVFCRCQVTELRGRAQTESTEVETAAEA